MKNPVRWFEIYVEEMDRAKLFYESVLKVKMTKMNDAPVTEMWGFPSDSEAWGCSGSLVKMQGLKPSGISTIVYFGSDDCSTEEMRVREFGGKIDKPKFSIGRYGFISLVIDTEGNMIGLHSMN
jgi:predicted enzyme related to lactoylglutathione lyase